MYLIRLDDACSFRDVKKWDKMEKLLDKYSVKPIVAIIPNCQDSQLVNKYTIDKDFWTKARTWQKKGWIIALHGYNHVYTNLHAKGINPINSFSEFAGAHLYIQKEKIRMGLEIFKQHGISTKVFVAPAHSFDKNTIKAIKETSEIRIISDTIASDIYYKNEFYFIPQQCGRFIKIPAKLVTGCYHPNNMSDEEFILLEKFLQRYSGSDFIDFNEINFNKRSLSIYDFLLRVAYFTQRKLKYIKKRI